jgi:hypothetical protein
VATSPAARFAASYTTLTSAHEVADYWVQTRHQATEKGRHGNAHENHEGRRACLAHVVTYTAISTAAVSCVNGVLRLGLDWRGVLAGQVVSSASHYFADRRYPLRQLAARTGRLDFHDTITGGPMLDQSWHKGWLAVAAMATAVIGQASSPRGW